MIYRIEEFSANRWIGHGIAEDLPQKENVFDSKEMAEEAMDKLRKNPLWTMAQLRVVPCCKICNLAPDSDIHNPWNTTPAFKTHEFSGKYALS